jgi:hypothetical protein
MQVQSVLERGVCYIYTSHIAHSNNLCTSTEVHASYALTHAVACIASLALAYTLFLLVQRACCSLDCTDRTVALLGVTLPWLHDTSDLNCHVTAATRRLIPACTAGLAYAVTAV